MTQVRSFTKGTVFDVQIEARFLTGADKVLIIDDFLARGEALKGLIDIVDQSGAALAGCGIVIEKGFQDGGEIIRGRGVNLKSLAIIDSIDEGLIQFRD